MQDDERDLQTDTWRWHQYWHW